jgi:hypothetical protein
MLEIIFWSVGLLVLLVVLYLVFSRPRNDFSELDLDLWQERWRQIEKYLESDNAASWRLAVIEADKFLDGLLKQKGIGGESLGQRLKIAQSKYYGLKKVWPAHLLRNRLVHENDYYLSRKQARQAVKQFRQAAADLGYNIF